MIKESSMHIHTLSHSYTQRHAFAHSIVESKTSGWISLHCVYFTSTFCYSIYVYLKKFSLVNTNIFFSLSPFDLVDNSASLSFCFTVINIVFIFLNRNSKNGRERKISLDVYLSYMHAHTSETM